MGLESRSTPEAVKNLVFYYASWKLLLLIVAAASPGPGYDTSTGILLSSVDINADESSSHQSTSFAPVIRKGLSHLATKLVRWDAFYYVGTAQRGHALYEQEWAFGWGQTQLLHLLTAALPTTSLSLTPLVSHALMGICISHICHLLSVLLMYALTLQLLPRHLAPTICRRIASTAAGLLIVSPAGLFLSSPYAEGAFSTFQLSGLLLCVEAWKPGSAVGTKTCLMIAAGACFGVSSLFRSNGIFNGLVLVEPFLLACRAVVTRETNLQSLFNAASIACAGLLTLAGAMLPQILAYHEYCMLPDHADLRPWCHHLPPSIYTWVQSHYWGVGLFRYWTLSNIPLFLVALPMLVVLVSTAWIAMSPTTSRSLLVVELDGGSKSRLSAEHGVTSLRRLALPQIVLAFLALSSFHVQIINRISSGYPIWCIILALLLTRVPGTSVPSHPAVSLLRAMRIERIVKAMVMYAIIQGGLYASFLPPA